MGRFHGNRCNDNRLVVNISVLGSLRATLSTEMLLSVTRATALTMRVVL